MQRRTLLFRFVLAAAVLLWLSVARLAEAQLELDITEGVVEPLPVAVSEFYGAAPDAAARGRDIADVVSADLERSGLFGAPSSSRLSSCAISRASRIGARSTRRRW